jgi:hypothetical protein
MEVRNYLLCIAGRSHAIGGSTGSSTNISISWPIPSPSAVPDQVSELAEAAPAHGPDGRTSTDSASLAQTSKLDSSNSLLEDGVAAIPRGATVATSDLDASMPTPATASIVDPSSGAPRPIETPEPAVAKPLPAVAAAEETSKKSTPVAEAVAAMSSEPACRGMPETSSGLATAASNASASEEVVNQSGPQVSTEVDTDEATKLEVNTAEAKNSASGLDLDKRETAVSPLDVSQDNMLPGSSSMELFPGEGDGDDLSIPELCMDSASDDDNPLAGMP